ncbi:MAG: type II TA system antitoxin MqsA family protein [Pseudomonadota bacterium]
MKTKVLDCPNGHGKMQVKKLQKSVTFRGEAIALPVEHHVCKVCGLEAGSIDQAAKTQRKISDAYRSKVGLLTGEEIREGRKKQRSSQAEFAERLGVGIASIKRWEGGLIQTRSMDRSLRMALEGKIVGDSNTGNQVFSIPRVKLVLRKFESCLKKSLLEENDKMLYAAKYLWYADMVAFRDLGRSLTGATYAALPLGPQLNNYRDLIDHILKADETSAERLTEEEERIIGRVSKVFPRKKMVFDAAHQEDIWKTKAVGALIPYSDASELKTI